MKQYNPDPDVKKVRYTASVIYLLVLAFLVIGSYLNQKTETIDDPNTIDGEEIIWSTPDLITNP